MKMFSQKSTTRSPIIVSLAFLFAIGTPAVAQTAPTGRLDFLKSKDPSFALFVNTSSTWSTSGKQYPNELVLLTGLPSNPKISARIDLLGPVAICALCGGLRNAVISPDGDTALVSSDPSDTQPPATRAVTTLFVLRNVRAFALSKNPADLNIRTFKSTDFPQLENVSGLAFGPDGHWAVVNTGGPGYLDLTYATVRGAVVVITGLPDNPVFSAPFPVPMHSLGNLDLSLDGETLLLNDTVDFSSGVQRASQIVVRGIRPGSPSRAVSIATNSKPPKFPDGPAVVRDARLTLDGRFILAPIPLIQEFDPQQNLPVPVNQIAILGPIRNGTLDTARLLTQGDGVTGGPYQAGVSPDGDSALVVNALDAGGANLLTGLNSGDPAKIKVSPLPFPFFGPPFPLGPAGPPVLAPHGQVIYTSDGDSALVVNFISPPLANLPLAPSVSVLTGFQGGNIRVASTLSDPTFNPYDNRQQIATAPAGLADYINLFVPAGASRSQLTSLLNDAITRADRGDPNGAVVDQLVSFIRLTNSFARQNILSSSKAAVLRALAISGIQVMIGHADNFSIAEFGPGAVAPDSIATMLGDGFGASEGHSNSRPFPTSLGGVNVTVIDSAGEERPAPLFLTLPTQISYIVPQGTAPGKGVALVSRGNQITAALILDIEPVSPGLLTNARVVEGAAAALVQRIKADGSQRIEPVTDAPIDLGPPSDQVFLLLFGTGIRGRSGLSAVTATAGGQQLAVSYAGPQADSPGLDQVNLLLPRSLIGRGQVEIALSMDGWNANRVTVNIQ